VDGKIQNSASRQRGGTLGLSYTGADTSLGVSIGQSRDIYGVVIDPVTTIDMRSTTINLKAQQRNRPGFVRQISRWKQITLTTRIRSWITARPPPRF